MRYFIYISFLALVFFSCKSYNPKPFWKPSWYPLSDNNDKKKPLDKSLDKPFKEIRFDTWYQNKYTEEEKNHEMTFYDYCFKNDPMENNKLVCKLVKSRIAEDQVHFNMKSYCYDVKQDKESIFNKSLKARLYDKEANILAEDYLRCDRNLDGTETCDQETTPHLNFYFPYFKKADKVKVIKIKDGKEITLNEIDILSEEKVKSSKDYGHGFCSSIYLAPIY